MEPTGLIFAALDCDMDALEEWNRWYDLEHVPPNVSMPGVMLGRRYVSPPALLAARRVDPTSGFAGDRALFITTYALCGDPAAAFDDMSTLLTQMYAGGRMVFPAEKKAVREGDVLRLSWCAADPAGTLQPIDVPFVGHTGVIVVQRRNDDALDAWYRDEWAASALGIVGVHGVASYASLNREGLRQELVFVEGDGAALTAALRERAPHHPDATIVLEAPFDLITPLRYPFIEEIRSADLPRTVA